MIKNIFKYSCLLAIAILFIQANFPTEGYKINLIIEGFQGQSMIVAYHYGDKQFIKDTVKVSDDGSFVFTDDEPLQGGMYIAFFPELKKSFEFLVSKDQQNFTLKTNLKDFVGQMKVTGSKDNELFYQYLNFLGPKRQEMGGMNQLLEKLKKDKEAAGTGNTSADLDKKIEELTERMKVLDKSVRDFQDGLARDNPKSFTAAIINVNKEAEIPEEISKDTAKAYYYYWEHFFDNIDLTDERLVRSPLLHPRVERFLSKSVTIQHPDTVIRAVDFILKKAEPSEEVFKFLLIRLLNKYAKSKIVCMDAVYVHMVDKYYAQGKADWIDDEQLKKIKEDAAKLRPLLCNKVAPNIAMQTFDKPAQPKALHDIKSKYTVLFFWAPDCGHCKKAMPQMVDFYDTYKSKEVEVFAVCTKSYKSMEDCRKMIEEKDMGRWLNVVDPYYRSRFRQIYDIVVTPIIYILDENKNIIAKKVGSEQLSEVMDQIISNDKKKEEKAVETGK